MTFGSSGTFVIGVGKFDSFNSSGSVAGTPPASGDSYTLNMSVANHATVGDDTFNIQASTPADVVTVLDGNQEQDLFVFSDAVVLTGTIDGGTEDDLIDWSAVAGPLTVTLDTHGALDGFSGDQTTTIAQGGAADGFHNIDAIRGTAASDTLEQNIAADRTHWDIGGMVSGYGPFGSGGLVLSDSLADAGVLISDEAGLSPTGNANLIGRAENDPLFAPNPPQPNPIVPDAPIEDDLAFTSFENLIGAESADDRFDFRAGASISGDLDGRGSDVHGDSLDLRDYVSAVVVNLGSPNQSARSALGIVGNLVPGVGSDVGNSIENVFGGVASDTIVGDQADNILGDGPGDDMLDGGWWETGVASPEHPAPEDDPSGNDIFRLEPGAAPDGSGPSSDVLTDLNGNDTVDFRFADSNVMIDLDLLDTPMDVFGAIASGQLVTLAHRADQVQISPSMFENVVGSQFNDIIYIDPLAFGGDSPENGSPVARHVDGNDPFVGGPDDGHAPDPGQPIPPGDAMHFEAFGNTILDTGFSITAAGIGTVTHESIETPNAVNQAPRTVSSASASFVEKPITAVDNIGPDSHWIPATAASGDYLFHYPQIGATPNTASWYFHGIQPGRYQVSVTYPGNGGAAVATDAPFSVFDDTFKLSTVDINQRMAPNDFQQEGVFWETLGVFDFTSHTALVQLSDRANGQVLADRVRLERFTPGPELTVLSGSTAVNDGVSFVNLETTVGKARTQAFTIKNTGNMPLLINDIDLAVPGSDPRVAPPNMTLSLPTSPSFGTPEVVAPGGTYTFSVTLNALQDPFGGDPNRDGHGDFPAELRIFSNDLDEAVMAKPGQGLNPDPDNDPATAIDPFTVQLRGVVSNRSIIDNGDSGFQLIGTWPGVSGNGYQGDQVATKADSSGNRARWTFNNLPDGTYRVSTTWAATPQFVGDPVAPYLVSDINGTIGGTTLNQSVTTGATPGSFADAGVSWVDLGGPYAVTGGKIVVELLDTGTLPNRWVLADAVRVERLLADDASIPFTTNRPDITVEDGGQNVADDTGVVDFGSTWPGMPQTKTLTIRNDGGADLVVREPVAIPAGFTLLDFPALPAGDPRTAPLLPTGSEEFTLEPGESMTIRVRLDAGYPGDFDGEISFPTGDTLSAMPATVDPDETPFNFRLTGEVSRWDLIDDEDTVGFAESNFELSSDGGLSSDQGFNRAVHYADAANPPTVPVATASWTFDDLTDGAAYRVSATWSPFPNRATNAPFSVDPGSGAVPTPVNQRLTPDDLRVNGTQFEDLGNFVVDGTTLTVTLTNVGANGQVIADAVRIAQVVDPEIVVEQPVSNRLVDSVSVVDFGTATVNAGGTVDREFTIRNQGARPLTIGTPHLPAGFSVVSGLPASIPAGGSATLTIGLERDLAGAYDGTLILPADELDENPFEIRLSGDVVSAPAIVDDGDLDFGETGPGFAVAAGGFAGDHRTSTAAAGNEATWSFNVTPGVLYRVSTTWVEGGNRATNAPFEIAGIVGGPTTVNVNQQAAPSGFTDQGAVWQGLDIVEASGGTLTVSLADTAANGVVVADAVRVETLKIINNEDPSPFYGQTGFLNYANLGRLGTVDGSFVPSGTDAATFSFTNLTPGLYRVSTTWVPFQQRATDAPYTIYDGTAGGTVLRTVEVNQRLAPNDFTTEGSTWEDLDIIRISGTTLTVQLTEGSNGDVVADAVRVERLPGQPEIALEDSLGASLLDRGTFDFGSVAAGGTSSETFTLRNLGEVDLTLATLRLPTSFVLTAGPSSPVAPGGSTTFTIEFQPSRVDTFTGAMRLANSDSNENPFQLNLAGSVVEPVFIVDNDNTGYSEVGPLTDWNNQGFADPGDGITDVDEGTPGGLAESATWTFTLDPNTTYRVAATWTAAPTRASNAPFTIDGDLIAGPLAFEVDQRVAPGDFSANGADWEDLTIVRTDGTASPTLTVTLTDQADGAVIADAIRVEALVGHGPEILVSGPPHLADGDSFEFGDTPVGTPVDQTFTVYNAGTSGLTLDNASLASSLAGIPGFSLTTGFTPAATPGTPLAPGASATFVVTLDAAAAGSYGGTIMFDNNDADESPFEIVISGTVSQGVLIVDNTPNNSPWPANPAGTTFSQSGGMTLWAQGFQNDVYESPAGGAVETATYTFPVVDGGIYQLATTWTPFGNRASAAPYAISGVTAPATVNINQRLAPNDFSDAGASWEQLGLFTASGSTITVVLSGSTTGNVIIDAVRLERVTDPEIEVLAGMDSITSGSSTFDFGSRLQNAVVTQTFTVNNIGATDLILQPISLTGDFTLASANFSPNQVLPAGMSTSFEVALDTSTTGSKSGSVSFGNNDGDESPFNFLLAADVSNALIIDDGDPAPGYTDSANMTVWAQGFQNDVREAVVGGTPQDASYVFSGLAAGTYRVSATWTPFSNRASNAPYVINGSSVSVNQKLAPNNPSATTLGTSVLDSGAWFADLSVTATPIGGTITVDLSDAGANGNVIIDAVRVERLGPLHAEAGSTSPTFQVVPGEIASFEVDRLVETAVDYWASVDPAAADQLAGVQAVVTDLPPTVLGLGSFTSPTIWLDADAAGMGWHVDARSIQGRATGVDLLTVITHELGHVLGLPDLDPGLHTDNVMAGTLPVGLRRLPGYAAEDVLTAGLMAADPVGADRNFAPYPALPGRFAALLDPAPNRHEQLPGRLLQPADRLAAIESALELQVDDGLLSREAGIVDRDDDDGVHDVFFAALGDESLQQKDGSRLLED